MLTDTEQLFLELMNAARLDPEGEAARQGIALEAGLAPGAISGDPVQPLAPNARLQQAAADHGRWILAQDTFAHTGAGGSSPGDRMAAAGYEFGARRIWGENLAALGTEGTIDPAAAIDPGINGFKGHFDGLYESPDHRATMFLPEFRETGVSQEVGTLTFEPGPLDTSMLTNTFATPGEGVFLTGVVYDDAGRDGYTVGDGTAGVEISAGGATMASQGAGGYTLELAGGPSVDVTLGSGAGAMRVSVDMSGDNVKLDLVDGNRILTSGDIVLGTGAQSVGMLGAVDSSATGNRGDNLFHVGRGDNTLIGGGGVDRAVFTGTRADYEIDQSEPGRITISDARTGPESDGVNVLGDIDFADFSDTSLSFLTVRLSTLDAAPGGNTPLTFSLSDGSTQSLATDSGGKVALTVPEGMTGRLDTAAGAGDPAALEVGDALDVLRLAVGLEPSFGPATPFDLVAADVDRSGHVGVDDALDVLRAAVGLDTPGAAPGELALIDPAAPPTGLAPGSVTFTSGADIGYGLAVGTLDLQMVTLGDLGAANAV
jgi:hypothetical protein